MYSVRYIMCPYTGSPIINIWAIKKGLCPKAEAVYQEIMSIPLYPKMTDQDVEDVIHAVKKVICYYAKNKE